MASQVSLHEHAFSILSKKLTPSKPVRDPAQLRGRDNELAECVHQLAYGGAAPFIYGDRGIGKTSLAYSSAQQVCKSDRDPVYIACSPGMKFITLVQEALIKLSTLSLQLGLLPKSLKQIEATISLSPALKFTWNVAQENPTEIQTASSAIRLICDFDTQLPHSEETVIIFDELENLDPDSKGDMAYFIKQVGDQDVQLRFIYVGIAENIQNIIGEHESVPRYLHQVKLLPIAAQHIMDIAEDAATSVEVKIPRDILIRIAIVANGYPHFGHLMALHILTRCVMHEKSVVSEGLYRDGLNHAVQGSHEKLAAIYDKATLRSDRVYKRVLWTMANSRTVDQNVDDVVQSYGILARTFQWEQENDKTIRDILLKLRQEPYGSIIQNTTQKKMAGQGKKVYRYVRFTEPLMSAYVRLRAEDEGVPLGTPDGTMK